MAMKPCKECGKEISTDAASCPNCGKRNPTGLIVNTQSSTAKPSGGGMGILGKLGLLMLLGFAGLVWLASRDPAPRRPLDRTDDPDWKPTGKKPTSYVPTSSAIPVDNKKLWADYEANEVAADRVYKDQVLLVSGAVSRIDKDAFGGIVVGLRSPNPFLSTRAHLAPEYADTAAKLSERNGHQIAMRWRR